MHFQASIRRITFPQTTLTQNFKFSMLSVPEILSKISYLEKTFQYHLRRLSILIDEMQSDFTKIRSDLTKICLYHFKSQ